ncbi:MAG TPA: hypothetical protein VK454_11665 [Myxococcaceae bacterium]|nr:hypothetical protein [Myxococcaceae bacterium]
MYTRLSAAMAALLLSGAAHAGDWKQDHPRRAEVNSRLNNQNKRIRDGVEDGQLTKGQAKQLHQEDHAIRQQERAMAAQHGGHITKADQRQLNQEENQVSRQIYDEKHPAATK